MKTRPLPSTCCCDHSALQRAAAPCLETRRSLIGKLLAGGVAALPILMAREAQADPFRPGVAEQRRIGQQAAQEILQKYREVRDSRARDFQRVGFRLVEALPPAEQTRWDYTFRVLESREVNAFALPGGPMFIYTGLLERIHSVDALAAVTAHEIAHVRGEHWARQVEKQQKQRLGIGLLLGLTRANRDLQQLAFSVDALLALQYSRGDEFNADERGLQNMEAARFDPHGMIELFELLQKASGGREGGISFLRTHPLTRDRIARVRAYIARRTGE
ncbi:MAG: M48 family metalloprotease [Chloroherpetonaceae bacterium]|nr:M48 family metalloprotease [Chthonomonadaceae bacterium]MDW8209317.1 M48 family metalloprotease [Chloroherpetonaceae bacterium]